MSVAQIIEADLTWTGDDFQAGVRVRVDDAGRIDAVGALPEPPTVRLAGRAILPGFVNAHSHAFQRGLRGRGESFPGEAGSFWSWREAMYDLVETLDAQRLYELSRQAFEEMLDAGITTVGEFHYLHHDASGTGYALDEVVLAAGRDAGIRMVLLNAYYRCGGFDRPLQGGQRRFATPSLESYWAQMDRLGTIVDGDRQRLGAVCHSVRAVPPDDLGPLHAEAARRRLVFHMHLEEQPREIEDCLDAHGRTPMKLVAERAGPGPDFTAVHCTHTAAADLEDLFGRGGGVCLCPLTEANLGDGLPSLPAMLRREARICLGTDSNARISMLEEMRWLEYAHRLAGQRRGVCRDETGRVGPRLLGFATAHGARSLGVRTGAIRPEFAADLVAVDLSAPSLRGWDGTTLLESLILGADREAVADVCIGGRWRRGPVPALDATRDRD